MNPQKIAAVALSIKSGGESIFREKIDARRLSSNRNIHVRSPLYGLLAGSLFRTRKLLGILQIKQISRFPRKIKIPGNVPL